MKNKIIISGRLVYLVLLPILFVGIGLQKAHAQDAEVSYQTFYDELSPYGQWIDDAQYGSVFLPNTEPGFRPYATDGHWVMTDQGNMWMSDAPWAWAGYHYGRWAYNSYYGWVWVPGYEWAPAWVCWRSGSGFFGWAPLCPGYIFGGSYDFPDDYWVFVNPSYLYDPSVYNYYAPGSVSEYVHQTTYLTYGTQGSHYYYGPRKEIIERETHHSVEVYRVANTSAAGVAHVNEHEVSIYHPAINRESVHTARPSAVIDGKEHAVGRPESVVGNNGSKQTNFRQDQQRQQEQQKQQKLQEQQKQQEQEKQRQQYGSNNNSSKNNSGSSNSTRNSSSGNREKSTNNARSNGYSGNNEKNNNNAGQRNGQQREQPARSESRSTPSSSARSTSATRSTPTSAPRSTPTYTPRSTPAYTPRPTPTFGKK